jgi:7-cyano-7-deazaguanine synthase
MCSISGFIRIQNALLPREPVITKLSTLLDRSAERGKDSVGVVAITAAGQMQIAKQIRPTDYSFVHNVINEDLSVVIANNRAEPTTEYVQYKTLEDVQPFISEHIVASHNGVIANDKELRTAYHLRTPTTIDSAVIPSLIEQIGLESALQTLIGSYALAVADSRHSQKLWLVCNYKPLFLQYDPQTGALWFASQAEYLDPDTSITKRLRSEPIVSLSPYSLLEVDGQTGETKETVLQPRERNRRALVICSGGLDSTTTAKWAQMQGYEVTLLHFRYRCRAEEREVEAVKAIAQFLGCNYRIEDLGWLGQLGGNPLTDTSIPLHLREAGAEFAHEWVPARNLVFCALAAALADRFDYDTILLGLNLEEGGAYPDNTVAFYQAVDKACDIGTKSRPRILSPLANLVKHEIVKLALDIGAPIHLSWSCYEGGLYHCGNCGPCFMRRNAFRMNDVPDPIKYEKD